MLIRFALCVIAASVVFLNIAAQLIQNSNFGNTQPTEISFGQLATEGPGGNAFVHLVNRAVVGDPVKVLHGKREYVYIPLFPSVADSKADTAIRVVLKIDPAKSDQLPAILNELADPNNRVEGLCYQQLGKTDDFRFVEQQYQRVAANAQVIQYGSPPKMWQLFLGLGIIAIVYTLYFLGTLLLCKSSGKPRTRTDRISMVVTGAVACLIGGVLYYQNASVHIFATIGLTFVGIGLARMLVGKIALKIEDHLFTGNWFLQNHIHCDNEVFRLRSGRKHVEVPIEEIEAIGLAWFEDGHSYVDRNRFSLRHVTKEGKSKTNGVILHADFGKYAREFSLLHDRLEARFWNQLTDGNECSGEGWRLNADELHLKQNKSENIEIPVESLTDVQEIGGELRFWVRGNEEHIAALPCENLNVELLSRCLKRLLQLRPSEASLSQRRTTDFSQPLAAANTPTQPQTGLGIIKFTETSKQTAPIWLAGLFPIGAMFCIYGQWIIGLPCILGSLFALVGLLKKQTTLRIHEHGISLKCGEDLETLAFQDMESVTCKTKREMSGTEWRGNSYDLQFEGSAHGLKKVIRFASPVSVSDAYQNMVQKASLPIARQMTERLSVGGKVEWFPDCFMYEDGLEAPFGSLVKGKARKIEYHLISDLKIEKDRLRIFTVGKMTAAFVIDMSQENFTAGYLLLKLLLEASSSDPDVDAQCSAESVGS